MMLDGCTPLLNLEQPEVSKIRILGNIRVPDSWAQTMLLTEFAQFDPSET